MQQIRDQLLMNKPQLTDKTVDTYCNVLRAINGLLNGKNTDLSVETFTNKDPIMKIVETKSASTARNYVIALNALFPDLYKQECAEYIEKRRIVYESKEFKDNSEEKNIIPPELISECRTILKDDFNIYLKLISKIHKDKETWLHIMQKHILFSFYFTEGLRPRRALDYAVLKFRNYDIADDNYIDMKRKVFVFNNYKQSAQKGAQIESVPKELFETIKKYTKLLPPGVDTVLTTADMKPLPDPVHITRRLNEIFGEKYSVNACRHTYLTSKYKKTLEALSEAKEDMTAMGSSIDVIGSYVNTA